MKLKTILEDTKKQYSDSFSDGLENYGKSVGYKVSRDGYNTGGKTKTFIVFENAKYMLQFDVSLKNNKFIITKQKPLDASWMQLLSKSDKKEAVKYILTLFA